MRTINITINTLNKNHPVERGFSVATDADSDGDKMDNSLPVEKDRLVKTTFTLNVSAYLLPERMVDKHGRLMQTTQERFSIKKVVTFIETETR